MAGVISAGGEEFRSGLGLMAKRLRALALIAPAVAVTGIAAVWILAIPAGPVSVTARARPDGGALASISCPSAGDCAVVGSLFFPSAIRPLVLSEKDGAWGSARTIPGLAALPGGDQLAELLTVSCSSAGNCAAGGGYTEDGRHHPISPALVVTERDGVWGKAAPVPGLAALNKGGLAVVDHMSCRSAGDCTASGTYLPVICRGNQCRQVFVVSEKNGTWGRAEPVPGLPSIASESAQDNALSCVAPGNCTIGGSYDGGTVSQAYVASQENGVWSRVRTFPAGTGDGASMDLLSCQPGGNCTGTGIHYTSDNDRLFAVTETNGTWGAAKLIPGISALPGGRPSFPADSSLSCPSAGNCTVGGTYASTGERARLFVAAETDGTWGRARALVSLAALNASQMTTLAGVVCFRPGNCTAAGDYIVRGRSRLTLAIFVTAEKNGVWGKPEQLPGSSALSRQVGLAVLACDAPGDCSAGGFYDRKHSEAVFVVTVNNGTWGKAKPVSGIKPLTGYFGSAHRNDGTSMRSGGGRQPHLWAIVAAATTSMGHCCGCAARLSSIDVPSLRESAGINRHGGGDGRALRRRASVPRRPSAMRRRPARAWRSVGMGTCRPGY